MENLVKTHAPPESAFCALAVTTVGMTIKVAPGPVRFGKEDFELLEEETFDVVVGVKPVGINGYLVETGGDFRLLVVEHVHDVDLHFDFADHPEYRLITVLFSMLVLPGTTDLAAVDRTVQHVVPREPEVV